MGGLPLETWVQIGALAAAAALVVGLLALARGGRAAAEGRIERRLLAEQLREQERVLARSLNDTRHTVAAQLTALRQSEQRAILTGAGRLHQAIERRLGDLKTRLAADPGALRAELATQLGEIGGRVDQRLAEGFEKTTETFGRVLSHLAHLRDLADDFTRFEQRMDSLARHIAQAHQDVDQVATSARRISGRFGRIERVEIADGGSDS